MKALTILVLAAFGAASAWTVTSNDVTMTEQDVARGREQSRQTSTDTELLVNGDFESGELTPWVTNAWMVTTKYPHGGTYCASDVGNYYIQQDFTPTPGSDITSITFWMRQPEAVISWCGVYYEDQSEDHIIAYPDTNWTLVDLTSIVNPSKNVIRLKVYGYSGGGPDPDSSFLDDASIQYQGTGVHEPGRSGPAGPVSLSVSPNPLSSGFARVQYALPRETAARVEVLDVAGRRVAERELGLTETGAARLDLRSLENGVYLVRLSGAGCEEAAKLVIRR